MRACRTGRIIVFVLQWAVFGGIAWYGYKYFKKPKPKEKPAEVIPEEAIYIFRTADCYRKPFQGYFVLGAAGSGNFRQTRWNVQCSCYTQVWRGTACFVCRVYQYLYAGAMWIPRFFLMYSEHEYKQLNFRDMKKKIKLYIAVSLDGYIARPDGNLDWLTKYPMPTGTEYGYKDLMDSIDTIIMGGKTYRAVLDMDFEWPYSDKACYIVSHRNTNLTPTKNVKFITENVVETVKALKQQDGKDIWLVGGGQVITLLLNHDLVDEMQICYIPVILGNGIPLFPNQPKESTWKFAGSEAYDSGIVKITYVIG